MDIETLKASMRRHWADGKRAGALYYCCVLRVVWRSMIASL